MESPLNDPNGKLSQVLYYIDISLTTIFVFEAGMKLIAFGVFFKGEDSYFRSIWNIMDFAIVLISVNYLVLTL